MDERQTGGHNVRPSPCMYRVNYLYTAMAFGNGNGSLIKRTVQSFSTISLSSKSAKSAPIFHVYIDGREFPSYQDR